MARPPDAILSIRLPVPLLKQLERLAVKDQRKRAEYIRLQLAAIVKREGMEISR